MGPDVPGGSEAHKPLAVTENLAEVQAWGRAEGAPSSARWLGTSRARPLVRMSGYRRFRWSNHGGYLRHLADQPEGIGDAGYEVVMLIELGRFVV